MPQVVRGKVGKASDPHPYHLSTDKWQSQLFCILSLRAGLPEFLPLESALLCCPDKVQGLLS